MSRRKAPSAIEIRCPDGLRIEIEHPPEELIRAVLQVIGAHARPDAGKARRPRLVEQAEAGNPL